MMAKCRYSNANILAHQLRGNVMNIRPISDLKNHYSDVETQVNQDGPVILTKNGYGSMVIMSLAQYERLRGGIDTALDAADRQAATTAIRYSHEEVFGSIRAGLGAGNARAV
jgi:prevent-host-death family protein